MNDKLGYIDLITNLNKENEENLYYVEDIPMCNSCLFEIKPGDYICVDCKVNLCESHKNSHIKLKNNHNTIKLKLKTIYISLKLNGKKCF